MAEDSENRGGGFWNHRIHPRETETGERFVFPLGLWGHGYALQDPEREAQFLTLTNRLSWILVGGAIAAYVGVALIIRSLVTNPAVAQGIGMFVMLALVLGAPYLAQNAAARRLLGPTALEPPWNSKPSFRIFMIGKTLEQARKTAMIALISIVFVLIGALLWSPTFYGALALLALMAIQEGYIFLRRTNAEGDGR